MIFFPCRFLRCYPNGSSVSERGKISLFLSSKTVSNIGNFLMRYKFGIASKSRGIMNAIEFENEKFGDGKGYGYSSFITHDGLFNNAYLLPDNKLTIMCEVKFNKKVLVQFK